MFTEARAHINQLRMPLSLVFCIPATSSPVKSSKSPLSFRNGSSFPHELCASKVERDQTLIAESLPWILLYHIHNNPIPQQALCLHSTSKPCFQHSCCCLQLSLQCLPQHNCAAASSENVQPCLVLFNRGKTSEAIPNGRSRRFGSVLYGN